MDIKSVCLIPKYISEIYFETFRQLTAEFRTVWESAKLFRQTLEVSWQPDFGFFLLNFDCPYGT